MPRRALVVAGLGSSAGSDALVPLARWALDAGRRPAAVDLSGGPRAGASGAADSAPVRPAGPSIPLATIPAGLASLARETPACVAAVVDRLRRHECAADLLIVLVEASDRALLARAAFLAGGIVLPLAEGDKALHEAFCVSRDLLEVLPGVSLLPLPLGRGQALERYRGMMRDFLGTSVDALERTGAGLAEALGRLLPPPEEGFLPALIARDPVEPRHPEMLEIGSLPL